MAANLLDDDLTEEADRMEQGLKPLVGDLRPRKLFGRDRGFEGREAAGGNEAVGVEDLEETKEEREQ